MAVLEREGEEQYVFMTWRHIADQLFLELKAARIGLRNAGSAQPRSESMILYRLLAQNDSESQLITHARRELELAAWFDEKEGDPDWAESLIAAVAEFSHYGHSGGSVGAAIAMLEGLLWYKPLSPISSNPEEWMDVSEAMGKICWQNRRDGRLFSYDHGKTWYSIEDPRWRRKRSLRARLWRRKWNRVREAAGDASVQP